MPSKEYREKHKDELNAKNRAYYHRTKEQQKLKAKLYQLNNPEKVRERSLRWVRNNPEKSMLSRARSRAKRKGIEFSLSLEDISIPTHCPILGIPLYTSTGKFCNNSPSLDRLDNDRGYHKNNIIVISNKANVIKNIATADELIKIGMFLKSYNYC